MRNGRSWTMYCNDDGMGSVPLKSTGHVNNKGKNICLRNSNKGLQPLFSAA